MYVLYEEDGAFKTGHIMTEADATLQIESESGKRSKVKRANCIFTFASPSPDILISQAEKLAAEIDLPFCGNARPPMSLISTRWGLSTSVIRQTPSKNNAFVQITDCP